MKINDAPFDPSTGLTELLIVPIFEDDDRLLPELAHVRSRFPFVFDDAMDNAEIYGKDFHSSLIHGVAAKANKEERVLLIGAGKRDEFDVAKAFQVASAAVRALRKSSVKRAAMLLRGSDSESPAKIAAAVEGASAGAFEIGSYKTDRNGSGKLTHFEIAKPDGISIKDFRAAVRRGKALAESVEFARRICNEPPNVMTPSRMAEEAKQMAKEFGLRIEVLDEPKLKKLGMNLLLSVGNGSEQPTRLMVLRYEPAKKAMPKKGMLALVGKAITFDTGGISLKPGLNMDLMKYDMAGGAAVLGAMRAIAILKPGQPVIGIVAAAENMPSGKATKPSDIIKSFSGKTVEVLNTDAEGRLVLGDAIAYARKLGASRIVDVATLTGAVIIALGDHNAGIMGNDQAFVDQIIGCGKRAGEDLWQLPLGPKYSKQMKSSIADLKNIGGPKGASITAAAFLQEFAEDTAWAHLDIAGTAWLEEDTPYMPCGPTGFAVRTLFNLAESS